MIIGPHSVTEEQFKNLLSLLSIGYLIQEQELSLNWNTYGVNYPCGSARCWLGWYADLLDRAGEVACMPDGRAISHTCPHALYHFGLSEEESDLLFKEPDDIASWVGPSAYNDLGKRIRLLESWINTVKVKRS